MENTNYIFLEFYCFILIFLIFMVSDLFFNDIYDVYNYKLKKKLFRIKKIFFCNKTDEIRKKRYFYLIG